MHGQKRRMAASTDLLYPINTKGVWFIFLNKDGHFTICERPEQIFRFQKDITEHTLSRWGVNFAKMTFDTSEQTIYKLS